MPRLCQTDGLSEDQSEILKAVRQFVDEQIIPVAQELEHADEYPTEIIEGLKELGVFGLTIPEEFGGLGESLLTYALVVEEIARGWMSVSRASASPCGTTIPDVSRPKTGSWMPSAWRLTRLVSPSFVPMTCSPACRRCSTTRDWAS